MEAYALNNLGAIYDSLEDTEQALSHYTEALRLRRKLVDRKGAAVTLSNLAVLYFRTGEVDRGVGLMRESIVLFERVGDRKSVAQAQSAIERFTAKP